MLQIQLASSVLEKLREREHDRALQEEFRDYTSQAKHIHGFRDFSIPFVEFESCLLLTDVTPGREEPFRGYIACSPTRGIKKERKIGRVIEGKKGGLIRRKVGKINPVPGRDKDIFGFEISVRNLWKKDVIQVLIWPCVKRSQRYAFGYLSCR